MMLLLSFMLDAWELLVVERVFFTYRTVIYYLAVCWGFCYGLFCRWAILAILPQDARSVILYRVHLHRTCHNLRTCSMLPTAPLCRWHCANQSQIVSVRYSFVISAGVANIVRTAIVSRFVLLCRQREHSCQWFVESYFQSELYA